MSFYCSAIQQLQLLSLSFQETSLQQSWVVALWSSQTTYIYQQQSIIYLYSRTYTVIKRKILKHFGAILGSLKSRCEKPGWNTGLFLLRHGVISWVWLKWLDTKAKITRSVPWVGLYSILGSYDQIYEYWYISIRWEDTLFPNRSATESLWVSISLSGERHLLVEPTTGNVLWNPGT